MSEPITTTRIALASRPIGLPVPGNFRSEKLTLPELTEGEVMLQVLYYSVDPYMRGRMNDAKSYVPPFQLNQSLEGSGIAKVITSKSGLFKIGDIVIG
ncbi:MAG: NADP-dependent oxidoreductase, partial [Azospira oryzae]